MSLDQKTIEKIAAHLEEAELNIHDLPKITDEYPELTMEDATRVNWEIRRRKVARGHKVVGMKMGFTSNAMRKQMGVASPTYGTIYDHYRYENGAIIEHAGLIHPRIEPELSFITSKDLSGPNLTVEDVLAATEAVVPSIEIVDSRFKDYKFDMVSNQADNSSSARFIVGATSAKPDAFDWQKMNCRLERNGEIIDSGTGAEVMDHPAASVACLVAMIHEVGEILPAGSFVMTGGMTKAAASAPGDKFVAHFDGFGDVSFTFS